ncbi:MAG: response regulator [Candidatus Ozemobacteraceae bacterium]
MEPSAPSVPNASNPANPGMEDALSTAVSSFSGKDIPKYPMSKNISDKVSKACLELIFQNMSHGGLTASLVAWLLICLQTSSFPLWELVTWASFMSVLFFSRGYFGGWVKRRDPEFQNLEVWRNWNFRFATLQAAGWGFASWGFFPLQFSIKQAFHLVTICAMGAGSVSVLGSDYRIIRTYILLSQIPLFLRLISLGDNDHLVMGIMSLLFMFLIWMNAIRMNRVIIDSFGLRFANEDLITELRKAKSDTEATNELLIRAKEEAEAANRAKSDFLAKMSHEIRTPMNAVLGFTAVLQADDPLPHQRERLDIVHTSATSLLRLLDNILDLSKVEAGEIKLERVPFDPEQVFFEPAELASAIVGERPIEIICDADELPMALIGDGFRLRQVLMNLLGNAVKFTKRGFIRLTVRLEQETADAARLQIAVSDTGIGIPANQIEKIFEPFTQADDSIPRRFGGTGLGLSISRKLVHLMGGELSVESEVGIGTRFSFNVTFPKTQQGEHQEKETKKVLHVLLLDDVTETRVIAARLLRGWGNTVSTARDSNEALSLLDTARYDLICIDLTRLEVEESKFVEKARKQGYGEKAKFMGFTSLHRTGIRQTKQTDIDLFCRKPLRPRVFREALRSLHEEVPLEQRGVLPAKPVPEHCFNVLVAEDNPVNQKLMMWFLKRAGHEVELVDNGVIALERLREGHFNLVFMDVSMPEMDGIEATWRARKEGCTVPIVICSASAMKEDIEYAKSAGANGFLAKPYSPEQLLEVVNRWARIEKS